MDEWHIVESKGKQVWRRKGDVRYVIYIKHNLKNTFWQIWKGRYQPPPIFATEEKAIEYLFDLHKGLLNNSLCRCSMVRNNNVLEGSSGPASVFGSWGFKIVKEDEDPNG